MTQLRTSRPLGVILAALVALLLAACGSSGTGSAAASANGAGTDASSGAGAGQSAGNGTGSSGSEGACGILSEDEVAGIIGADVSGSLGTELEGQIFCNYNDADGVPLATVAVIAPNAAISPQAGYDSITEGTEDVAGVGDQAKFATAGPTGTLYTLSDGNLYMTTVFVPDMSPEDARDATVELARLIIERH